MPFRDGHITLLTVTSTAAWHTIPEFVTLTRYVLVYAICRALTTHSVFLYLQSAAAPKTFSGAHDSMELLVRNED
ncbi:MAG: hypothetical protein ACREBW_10580 [Candidatus Micrarchaeaceae archaeon]